MKLIRLFAFLLLLMPGAAWAQSTAQQTLPGFLTTTGCPSGSTVCWLPYSSANPIPTGASSSTPAAATSSTITTGGTSQVLVTGPVHGCAIVNPATAAGEGIGATEPLYVNPTGGAASTTEGGTVFAIQPGQQFSCVPGQTTNVTATAATTGHKASVMVW